MKLTVFSNYLNHHQLPFCLEMYKLLGEDFKFVATESISEERIKMGYADLSNLYPFALNTYSSTKNYSTGLELSNESDVVIIGSAPELFIKNRLIQNKLTFRYSERIFKTGQWRVLNPRVLYNLFRNHTIYKNKNLYMLCASAYTACDYNLVGAYRNKTYKWGYYPDTKLYDIEKLFEKKDNPVPKLLWVGRFIDWKHPEHVIKLANMLKQEGYDFILNIIGTGVMKKYLISLIEKYKLEDSVKILESMSPTDVREYMELSNIYLCTSDFNEGWGAVINESMNSGCAVVASHAIGSIPFLLKNNVNGLVYKNGDLNQLFQCVKTLLDSSKLCQQLGKAAYKTLSETWNAKLAAERILKLSNSLLSGDKFYFEEGPCSEAKIIQQWEMYNLTINNCD